MKLKYFFLNIMLCISFIYAKSNTSVTGDVSYYYMHRLSDQSTVNIPFRMLNLNINHQNKFLDINGTFALEYKNRKDVDFMEDSNPVDINTVLRELYLTYYLNNGEISVGKKLHTWGSVDENSPIDVLNAFDYYYLLQGASERKLGTYSLSFDYYINNGTLKISGIFSPLHNANRYPIDDDEYEFGLPITIHPDQIVKLEKPSEFGFALQQSFNRGDITFSFFRGHDRAPSFSGFQNYVKIEKDNASDTWENASYTFANIIPDILYSYRLTEASNIGGVFLFNDFTIRYDYGMFKSYDNNNKENFLDHPCYEGYGLEPSCSKIDHAVKKYAVAYSNYVYNEQTEEYENILDNEILINPKTGQFITDNHESYLFNQKAEYTQQTFQIELPLTDDYQLNLQYFKYELQDDKFQATNPLREGTILPDLPLISLPDEITLEDIEGALKAVFVPGVGAPFSNLSSESCFISLEKKLLNNNLALTVSTLMDLDKGYGELASFEVDYNFGDGLNAMFGLTKVLGDDEVSDYVFNELEDFSHLRCEIKYHF